MISGKNKQLYYESSIDKQLNIEVIGTKHVIDNSMREQDTFTLTETLNDGTELKFGSCLPNQISFTGREVPIATKGMKLRVTETLEGNEDDPFEYGTYTVQSDTPTADRTKRQITAYDAMYDIINADVKSWYDGLTFPMTLKQFRDSFFRHLGIEQKKTSLVNDEMTVNKTLTTTQAEDSSVTAEATISGKTIIEAICEINGAFGNIGRDDRFEYVILKAITSALYPAEDLYPREDLFPSDANTESMNGHYITFDYEAFQSQAITQLEIRADDSTAGAIVGTSGNNYVISGNFLISDKTGAEMKQIANNLLPVIAQAAYTPIKSSECVGNPCLELGDPIRFNTSREIVESYILQRTLTGVQSKRDSIVSTGTEKHTAQNQTTREMVESLKRRTHTLEENADHLQSTYEDLEEQTNSKFEQTTNSISAEVNRAQKAEGELDASLELKLGEDDAGKIVSMINACADLISLKGGRITIESDNFSLAIDGTTEIKDVRLFNSIRFAATANGDDYAIVDLDGRGSPYLNIPLIQNSAGDIYFAYTPKVQTSPDGDDVYLARESWCNNKFVTGFSGDSSSGVYNSIHQDGSVISGSKISYSDLKDKLSDERLKKNVLPMPDITEVYMGLEPTVYEYRKGVSPGSKKQFGVIAQQTQKDLQKHGINPDLYDIVRESDPLPDTAEGRYAKGKVCRVDYDQFHAMHIQMIQAQQRKIEELEKKCNDLERRLSIIEGK